MGSRLAKWARRAGLLVIVAAVMLLAARIYVTQRGKPLEPWHTHVPQELSIAELDLGDWNDYLQAEQRVFEEVRAEVTEQLPPRDRVPVNRYFAGSPIYPGRFREDWNRSYELIPDGPPVGAVVLLHGLTDSPYSLRHIARRYRDQGFVAIAIRLPGHGTVPAGLTDVEWPEWAAATRLAVREARARIAADAPLHLVGFSNGGALALQYTMDALDQPELPRPQRLVLISPMIGVTAFARFAGLAGLPAIFPAFAKAAWLAILPEFNPFKYNSFPVNGARQSFRLTQALQQQINSHARDGRLGELPPILTFQSVLDFTVSTRAIITALYAQLPANGSELVLFDLNQAASFGPLLRRASDTIVSRLLPSPPRTFRTAVIANVAPGVAEVEERVVEAGATTERVRPLGLSYPIDVYSLSHVALPFPSDDALYGSHPGMAEDYGINLGTLAARGERGALIVSKDALLRMSSNPFFPYLLQRIEEVMAPAR